MVRSVWANSVHDAFRKQAEWTKLQGKADRHMRLLTIEMESRLGHTLGSRGVKPILFERRVWEEAKDEEMKIPWMEGHVGLPISEKQYQKRFWRRRMDGIGLDKTAKEFLAIEFKRMQDVKSDYVERATAVAQKQYKSLLAGLQAVGQAKVLEYAEGHRLNSS